MSAFRKQLGESAAAFRAVFANSNLRRLEIAAVGATLGGGAYSIAISVYAYHVGGASAVGILWLIRSAAGAVSAPLGGSVADRYRRELVMLWCELLRTALMVGIAVAVTQDAGTGTIYVLSALISVVGNAFIPAERSITPTLAETPAELTAANVLASTIESVGVFVGPAMAGVLLAVTNIEVVLYVSAGLLLWSAFYVALIRPPRVEVAEAESDETAPETLVTELLAGFKVIAADERLRVLIPILAATTFLVGAMEVLVVSIGINLLDIGNAGVGYLNTAFGVGALVGALITAGLVGLRKLSIPFIAGALIVGIPVALIGAHPQIALAVIWLGVLGAGNTLLEVAGLTLVQRAVPDNVLARAFGAIDFVWLGSVGLGAIVAPVLIHGIGIRETLVAIGCFLPAIVLLFGPRLLGIDARAVAPAADRLALLRTTPIFAPLSGVTLESVAARLIPLEMDAGAVIIREGDSGDRFYLIASGEVEVTAQGKPVATLGPGDYVGEIALLRDVPRTATVTAKAPVTLYALERDDFLSAVTSHAASRTQAERVVGSRLTGLQRATGRIVSTRF